MEFYTTYQCTMDDIHSKKNRKTKKIEYYSDDIFTFDIEVSSGFLTESGIISYYKGQSDDYWNNLQPLSLCYIWQFSHNENVYYGRELTDFLKILDKIPDNINIVIWVHNLAYEFQNCIDILKPFKSVFARSPHKPMKVVSERYPNIEFRCSYILTRLSLETWGRELNFEKLHTLDYDKLRTPKTELTTLELAYCERDCLVVYKGIQKYLEKYGHIEAIPLTQTGEVRKVIKKLLTKQRGYITFITKLIPNADIYRMLYQAFQGGYTHANYTLAGRVFGTTKQSDGSGLVHCFDFASSYPYVMCAFKYPSTPFYYRPYRASEIEDFAYLLELEFEKIESTTFNTYISYSKCYNVSSETLDNGRVLTADRLTITCTEIDFEIIKKTYKWKSVKILNSLASRKAYLPKIFIEYILELYGNKTTLKGVEEKMEIYAQSKQFINSLFGMTVTALVPDDVSYSNDNWLTDVKSMEEIDKYLSEIKSNNKAKIFLNYAWGVWVTAYARQNIWSCMLSLDNDKYNDVIYVDTDSIKCRGEHSFEWYNKEVERRLGDMCYHYNINFEKCHPVDSKGNKHLIGLFEEEDSASEFITLGAKRYCYRTAKDGKLHITVAGVNKQAVACLNNDIRNFKDGMKFDKDHESVTPKLLHYLNNMPIVVWNKGKYDEYTSTYAHGVNMRPRGYEMNINDAYELLINLENENKSQIIFR